jgi:cysteine desulfurase
MSRINLDDAGFAPVLPEVHAALRDVPEGNPSSPHSEGRAARAALDRARDLAALAMGADRTEISFTSSGTEAVNLALFGAARRLSKRGVIVTWAAEHQSVLGAVRRLQSEGHAVEVARVDGAGRSDPGSIPSAAALVSIGLANNEVGTIQPVAAIIARAHEAGALVHVDACAGPRWIGIPEGADIVSLSGHKLGAGRGGILFVRDGVRIDPLLYGGPQEWGRRAGREDVGATCAFADRRGEDLLLALDLAGISASSGSACASGSLDPSHVLLAMGLSLDAALGSLRLTTGYSTSDEEVARAQAIIRAALARSPARA